jgi:hypothetical protein
MWAVARKLIDEAAPGYLRIKYILQQDGKLETTDANNVAITKYTAEEDILRQVLAVMAAVASKIPLSVFKNVYFRNYTQSLDPKHNPPDHLKINRIVEVLADAGVLEFVKICNERRKLLRHGFISTTTDFVTDPHRKQSFGVILLDLVAKKYELRDGRTLFMSEETSKKISDLLLSVSNLPTLCLFFLERQPTLF